MSNRQVVLVCEKCGFRTHPYDPDDQLQDYHAWEVEMLKHCDEKHPKSPRYHNYVHVEPYKAPSR